MPLPCIEHRFDDRAAQVQFEAVENGVPVGVCFDEENEHSAEQKRQGWQAILDNFSRYVSAKASPP